ncbi:UNVERIFIED_CONTAM: hypothetical protein GTU68_010963 [Idotea baltica]|nr:hypothetical protein [Idotea baltica]
MPSNIDFKYLYKQLNKAFIADRHKLRLDLNALRQSPSSKALAQWDLDLKKSCAKVYERKLHLPVPTYDDNLPIASKRDVIKQAISCSQVVIIAGETGSGKTTQLPKICLELNRGTYGLIGHTQPRRIAAKLVAERIAQELNCPLGDYVSYQVRFEDNSNERSLIKVMTDGILLAETQKNKLLTQYDTLIIDEAHERSLNIDFLLGYLKIVLKKRPELKVIITSATIDVQRFSQHFSNAPIIEVSGRTYPVDVWYRPLLLEKEEKILLQVDQAVLQCLGELPGGILIFLPGEREIRELANNLRHAQLKHTSILPLYARLTRAEQNKIFQKNVGRKIVLATNVAETSLTVPDIRYVIDTGTARISRYHYKAKIQQLHIEAISQASANQRKGRCGRVEPGVCIRLYSEDDFQNRSEFTDPEILRTNLASVILKMLSLRLGTIEQFPFIEPPQDKAIRDGFTLLYELSAVDKKGVLTRLGRQLAYLPIDPRLGRILLEGARQNCLTDMLVIVSNLAVQDPRDRPIEHQQAADQAHAQWRDVQSDFISMLNLWSAFEFKRQELGSNAIRNWSRKNFLNYLRLREWRDVHRQLLLATKKIAPLTESKPTYNLETMSEADIALTYKNIHKSIITGFLGHIGRKEEEGDYLGSRQRRFWLHPSTGLARKKPQWVIAAELIDTSKLFARVVAKIEPDWIEHIAAHLTKENYFEPHWEKKRGQVVAYEQITLYGIVIVAKRPVNFGLIDLVAARNLFIQYGLVGGDVQSQAACLSANQKLLTDLETLEAKVRRRDVLVNDEVLFAFYDERLPHDICQTSTFNIWYKREVLKNPGALLMQAGDVLARETNEITPENYPNALNFTDFNLSITYHFEPNHPRDGVTLTVPAPFLVRLDSGRLEWLVPGLLKEKCIALVRGLPKATRKNFVPVPDYINAVMESLSFGQGSLTDMLGQKLQRMTGVAISDEAWMHSKENLDDHLKINIEVLDFQGAYLGEGRSLAELIAQFVEETQIILAQSKEEKNIRGKTIVSASSFENINTQEQQQIAGLSLTVYPALLDDKGVVRQENFTTQQEAEYQHRLALQRLLMQLDIPEVKRSRQQLLKRVDLKLLSTTLGSFDDLIDDILLVSLDMTLLANLTTLPRKSNELLALKFDGKAIELFVAEVYKVSELVVTVLQNSSNIKKQFKGKIDLTHSLALNDIKSQLNHLIYPGFLRHIPSVWLYEMPRYLQAIEIRLTKLSMQLNKDRLWMNELSAYWDQYQTRLRKHSQEGKRDEKLVTFRWMLEEYRVALFAQKLGTKMPVSSKRIDKQWHEVVT